MKKFLLVLLLLPLVFCGCRKDAAPDVSSLTGAVLASLPDGEAFSEEDEDYIPFSFAGIEGLTEGKVLFAETDEGRSEFGIFLCGKESEANAATAAIRAYLAEAVESRTSLLSLYPGEKLALELAHYEEALVGKSGLCCYYFALSVKENRDAASALTEELKK